MGIVQWNLNKSTTLFIQDKCVRKYRQQNGGYFVLVSILQRSKCAAVLAKEPWRIRVESPMPNHNKTHPSVTSGHISWYDKWVHIPHTACSPRPELRWCHNERNVVSNHQPHDCLLNRLFRRRSEKASELRVTGLCEGNSPVTGGFPTQTACNAENVSTWWRHHGETACNISCS